MKIRRCPEDKSKEVVLSILREFSGYVVNDIKQTTTKTADYIINDEHHKYMIEVTNTEPGQNFIEHNNRLIGKGFSSLQRGVSTQKNIANKIKRKNKQICATICERDFNIIWITVLTEDYVYQREVTIQTLYGLSYINLWDLEKMRNRNFIDHHRIAQCFYYDRFAFKSMHKIDAVVIDNILFVNPCKDISKFKSSKMYVDFAKNNWIYDPSEKIDHKEIFALDFDSDRSNDRSINDAFEKKYVYRSGKFVFIEFTSSFTMPKKEVDKLLNRNNGNNINET